MCHEREENANHSLITAKFVLSSYICFLFYTTYTFALKMIIMIGSSN